MALNFTDLLNRYATAPRVQSQQPATQPLYRPVPRVYGQPTTATPPSVPPPRFPDAIVPQPPPIQNSYTGTSQHGCRGDFIATEHRYPTRSRTSQLVANLLTAPPTGQHSTSSRYAAAANTIAITEQLAPPAINAVLDPTTDASLEYRHLIKGDTADIWRTSFAKELGRLANGVVTRMPTGSNTLGFIPKSKVPTKKYQPMEG